MHPNTKKNPFNNFLMNVLRTLINICIILIQIGSCKLINV